MCSSQANVNKNDCSINLIDSNLTFLVLESALLFVYQMSVYLHKHAYSAVDDVKNMGEQKAYARRRCMFDMGYISIDLFGGMRWTAARGRHLSRASDIWEHNECTYVNWTFDISKLEPTLNRHTKDNHSILSVRTRLKQRSIPVRHYMSLSNQIIIRYLFEVPLT